MFTRKLKFSAISISSYDFHITNKFTVWYGNSSFDITEDTLLLIPILKYMHDICLKTTLRIHKVLAAMQLTWKERNILHKLNKYYSLKMILLTH